MCPSQAPENGSITESRAARPVYRPARATRYLQAGITEAASRWIGGFAQSQGLRSGGLPELSFFQCDDCHHPQGQGAQASAGVPYLAIGALKALAAQGADAKGKQQLIEHSKELETAIQPGRDALLQALRNLSADVPAKPGQTKIFLEAGAGLIHNRHTLFTYFRSRHLRIRTW
jgi:hypothetical protein